MLLYATSPVPLTLIQTVEIAVLFALSEHHFRRTATMAPLSGTIVHSTRPDYCNICALTGFGQAVG